MQSCKKFTDICRITLKSLLSYEFIDEIIIATNDPLCNSNYDPRVRLIELPEDGGFSSNMIAALSNCSNKNALIILDDYVLPHPSKQPVDQKKLLTDAVNLLNERKDIACVRLNIFDPSSADFSDSIGDFVRVKDKFSYLCSLQPSVWKVNDLIRVLKSGENAWDAEINGSKRMRDMGMHAYISKSESMIHVNALRFGKYIRNKFVDYADSHGISVPKGMDIYVKKPKKDKSKKKAETSIVNLEKYRHSKKK